MLTISNKYFFFTVDLMFLEGPDVIFRVALALLSYHKEKLLLCDSFEEIMNYLKGQVPNIDKPILDKIMKQASWSYCIVNEKFLYFRFV